jgi:hypothetical protein
VLAVSLLQSGLETLAADLDPQRERLATLALDLSTDGAAEELFAHCEAQGLSIDVLVNNAGYACYGDAVDLPLERVSNMLALNVVTLTKLSMLFGKQMKERGRGSILNVGSIAGMVPTARFAPYSASKAYVNAFSVALRAELAPFGVVVTCLTPGPVATNFSKAAGIDTFPGASRLKRAFASGEASRPDAIAAAGYRGLREGRAHVLAGSLAWPSAILSRLVSQNILARLLKGM